MIAYTMVSMDEDRLPGDGVVFHAGFPNAAEDSHGAPAALSLDKLAVPHPASTYFWRLDGEGVPELALTAGTMLVVDKTHTPRHGDWVVVVLDEEFMLRQIRRTDKGVRLFTASGQPDEHKRAVLWGVVTYAVRPMRNS